MGKKSDKDHEKEEGEMTEEETDSEINF